MTKEEIILNIAANLDRLSLFSLRRRRNRIRQFLKHIDFYIELVKEEKLNKNFRPTFEFFKKEYSLLKDETYVSLDWAEKTMTLGNILRHRAKLA